MFLPYVSEFVEFLSIKEHTLEEMLAHMVLRTLAPLEATSAFMSQLNSENSIEYLGRFGLTQATIKEYPEFYNLQDAYPVCDAIRNRKIVWINTLPQWPCEYPMLANTPHETGEKTFVCFPIEKCGTPVAALGIFFKPVIHPDAEIDAFLKAIGAIFSLHVYRKIDSLPEHRNLEMKPTIEIFGSSIKQLTERQILILKMMSEERTNQNISELLGYSESTIRQETVKIFSNLNCNGREEASKIYKARFLRTPEVA